MEALTEEKTAIEKKPGKKRLAVSLLLLLACVTALLLLVLTAAEKLMADFGHILSWENAPLIQILWVVTKQLWSLCLPVLIPVISILLICLLLSTTKSLYTEKRRFGKLGWGASSIVILDSFQAFCLSILRNLPVLALVILTAVGMNSLFATVGRLGKIADNMKRIKELGLMVRNLSRVEDIARITMLGQTGNGPDTEKTYKVEILSETGDVVSEQQLILKGNRIAIDSITVNFEYSEIESGNRQNIAYPYRVYSENMKPDDAIQLTCMFNDEQLPVIYCLDSKEIYGMTEDSFFNRLKELFDILKDENLSREMGIRSAVGTVSHFIMNEGDIYDISVEATGGVTVHKKARLD